MDSEFNLQTLISSTFAICFVIYGMIVFGKDFFKHWNEYIADLLQPWKLVTLTMGLSWLFYGAVTYGIQDWDVGVSIIMASLTYISASWCVRAIIGKQWKMVAGVIIMSWFSIDGSYVLWHTLAGNDMLRDANLPASAALYWLCGFIWLPRGSLKDIVSLRAQHR